MNYAYVTVLSTNDYYKGVIALFESLKKTNPIYNKYVVVVNQFIEKEIIRKLESYGYEIIIKKSIDVSYLKSNEQYKYWMNTFDKLNIFELTEFDKIVYLDSDMYINRNIDELFNYPHMSAAIAGKGRVPQWVEIGSGMMVIVPKNNVIEKMLDIIKYHKFDKDIGDQDIIEVYFDWKNKNLAISENYNLFADFIDYYINNLNYKQEEIGVIHFIGKIKPWMLNNEEKEKLREKYKNENLKYQLYFFNKYLNIIENIE